MCEMTNFDISNNNLGGPLPDAVLEDVKLLRNPFLGSNIFSGPAPTVTSIVLEKLDISDDAFVGNLPDEYISFPTSELFSASVNCLSPQLLLSLCNSSNTLPELYLNGLQQSSLCKSKSQSLTSLPSCI